MHKEVERGRRRCHVLLNLGLACSCGALALVLSDCGRLSHCSKSVRTSTNTPQMRATLASELSLLCPPSYTSYFSSTSSPLSSTLHPRSMAPSASPAAVGSLGPRRPHLAL
ncbi:hypothetical protein IWZ03DRAFT_174475 [Phyllosticta citriasiana]|uniref:Secreted protein n=1 Tax=Phyllosticta citriasiana TaxID=595635 RepID=A0ABR1KNJ6_9PEZI